MATPSPTPQPRANPMLVGVMAGVLGLGLVTSQRLGPDARSLHEQRERLGKLEAELRSAPVLVDTGRLQDELDALAAERDDLAERLAERAAAVAPVGSLAELEVELTGLARACGLRLELQEAVGAQPVAAPPSATQAEPGRMRRWTLSGTYAALWTFLDRLGELSSRVVVDDLHLEEQPDLVRPRAASGGKALQIRMRLTL